MDAAIYEIKGICTSARGTERDFFNFGAGEDENSSDLRAGSRA
jgi:hypothetical protein